MFSVDSHSAVVVVLIVQEERARVGVGFEYSSARDPNIRHCAVTKDIDNLRRQSLELVPFADVAFGVRNSASHIRALDQVLRLLEQLDICDEDFGLGRQSQFHEG
jgi:hypothetical protein